MTAKLKVINPTSKGEALPLTGTNNGRDSVPDPVPAEAKPKRYFELLSPSELKAYVPPPGMVLVGDNHIVRGSVFVIGGPPGVGKSRASVALAQAGATGYQWFGLKVHSKFKALIIQNENGRFRLKLEFSELDTEALDVYVRVTPPPPYGFAFNEAEFRNQLREAIEVFCPEVVILDPWNAAARDEKARDYLETFNLDTVDSTHR